MAHPVIRIENLVRVYHMGEVEVRALDGLTLEIVPGEFVAVMGPSGSGKSTFMNIVGCLDRPTSGRYFLDGVDVSELGRDARAEIRNSKIGFVFQSFNLLARTSALENVELPLIYSSNGHTAKQRADMARRCLQTVGLAGREDHQPSQLSGGQQQRVAIARALINDPKLLLADEPTGNLDSRTSEEVMAVFQKLNDEGKTVVLITHEPDIAQHAKRVVVFRDGRMVEDRAVARPRARGSGGVAMLKFLTILKVGLKAIGRNKMRSILTALGIIIGVACVIAMIGVGQGSQAAIQAQISALGTNFLMVFPGIATQSGARIFTGNSTLTDEDVAAVKAECPAVAYVSPSSRSAAQIVSGSLNWGTSVQGVGVEWPLVRSWNVEKGTFFGDSEVRAAAKVCVLGSTVANALFEGQDPIGQMVRIKNFPFRVIGVLETKGGSVMGQDQDDLVVAPYTTVMRLLKKTAKIDMFMASAVSRNSVAEAQKEIEALLRQRHRLGAGQDSDFMIRSQQEIAQTADETSRTLSLLLASAASISLLVGGIGIMNIMLVSVTERTREIGIRMAIGAKGRDIRMQFLVEALSLSIAGGFCGIALGIGVCEFIAAKARWPILVSPEAVVLAFGFSAAIGVFFGFYPAQKASLLDPIEALRYE